MTSRSESRGPPTWRVALAAEQRVVDDVAGERADEAAGDRADRPEHRAAGGGAGRRRRSERRPSVGHSRESGTQRRGAAATRARARPRRRRRRHGRAPCRSGAVTIAACLAARPARQRNSSTSPGTNCAQLDLDQMPRAAARASVFAPRRLGPVARIGRHRLRLVADRPRARRRARGRGSRSRRP